MKIKLLIALSLVALSILSCTPTKETTGVWVNKEKAQGKKFTKLFIIVISGDLEARSLMENDLAEIATARGLQVVKSIDVMPPSLKTAVKPTKEEIVAKVKESGCDGVFVASLLKKEEDVRYTPGSSAYAPTSYYTYTGNFFGYYNHFYPTVNTPGYYSKEKSYFMQSNLYDVATEDIMWSVQSVVFDPSNVAKFSKAYTKELVSQLKNEQLIK